MTIIQLKYFLSVCEFEKIRIASEHLHVSEPTISISIKRLEEELGAPLFIRSRKHLTLTDEGQRLLERASDVVHSFDLLEAEMKRPRIKTPFILLGAPTTLSEYLCSRLISEYMEKNPSILFETMPISSDEAAKQVEDGKIELAICDRASTEGKPLEFSPILNSTLLGYVRNDHPLAGKENVTPQMLKDEKIILLNEKATISKAVIKWFRNADVEPKLFMYSNRASLTTSMVNRHNAVAFLLDNLHARNTLDHEKSLENNSTFTLYSPLCFNFGIICKKGAALTVQAQQFFDFCSGY